MGKIKTKPKTVEFNMSQRELCSNCGFPDGFCKHTIEKEYKDNCPNTPLDKESIWQLVRSHAIECTEKKNIWNNTVNEIKELTIKNNDLIQENIELKHFKKHIENIMLKKLKI